MGTAGSASPLLSAESISRELDPPLEGIKDFINPWVNAGNEFHCRSTACHFGKGKLTQTNPGIVKLKEKCRSLTHTLKP